MRKLLLFLLGALLLFSCEIYTETTNPQLNINGNWKIIDIIPTYPEGITITNSDYYAVSPFIVISTLDNQLVVTNDTSNIRACYFYKIGYQWEFDYNLLLIKSPGGRLLGEYYIGFIYSSYIPSYFYLTDKLTGAPIAGSWMFQSFYASGAGPANLLYITVPEMEFSIEGPQGSYDRLITQEITLILMR